MGRIMRYLRIVSLLVKKGLMQQMAYRPHFFSMLAGKVIRIVLLLLFFQAVFLKVDRIGSWGYDQVLLLFATFHVVDFLMSAQSSWCVAGDPVSINRSGSGKTKAGS